MDQASYTPASADSVLRFQQERIIKTLFRNFLEVLEDVEEDHNAALDKLVAALPKDFQHYVDLADHLTPEKGQQLRKRVLDRGNSALRDLDTLLKGYLINFK
jgi:hypothetical protein